MIRVKTPASVKSRVPVIKELLIEFLEEECLDSCIVGKDLQIFYPFKICEKREKNEQSGL